jgi:aminoglycoside phosphotransferase (APT) family kinase protein
MLREARIQQILRPLGIPVPRILAVSDDTSLLGVPFYVMEALTGVVVTDHTPVGLAEPANRARIGAGMIDTLAQLHSIPVDNGPIYDLGRPDGYLERQVRRFASLWEINTTRSLPQVAAIATVLAARLPRSQRASVVHGDYRLGNVMFEPAVPSRVQAVLDWEMATLGDPLADLGYFLATYSEGGVAPTPLHLSPATAEPGYPSTDELAKRYAAATGHLVELAWYKALALWKAAIFCEAIYTRWLRGERPGDDFALGLTQGVPLLLERASAALDGRG